MKTRLQSLGLLDRALRATTDEELDAVLGALGEDHREAVERLAGGSATPEAVREAATRGRIDGTMESLALVLTDAALADCIEKLGDHADNPTADQHEELAVGDVQAEVVDGVIAVVVDLVDGVHRDCGHWHSVSLGRPVLGHPCRPAGRR